MRRNYTDRREKAPKSGRVRSAPMVDEVMAALDALSRRARVHGSDDLVFPNAVGEHSAAGACAAATTPRSSAPACRRLRFHDLRHCFGTIAAQRLPLHTVQGYLGHAHISTTMRYVHHTPAARDVALLSEAIRAETVLISGHAGDTLAAARLAGRGRRCREMSEAPTGIEPVYTALQAAA